MSPTITISFNIHIDQTRSSGGYGETTTTLLNELLRHLINEQTSQSRQEPPVDSYVVGTDDGSISSDRDEGPALDSPISRPSRRALATRRNPVATRRSRPPTFPSTPVSPQVSIIRPSLANNGQARPLERDAFFSPTPTTYTKAYRTKSSPAPDSRRQPPVSEDSQVATPPPLCSNILVEDTSCTSEEEYERGPCLARIEQKKKPEPTRACSRKVQLNTILFHTPSHVQYDGFCKQHIDSQYKRDSPKFSSKSTKSVVSYLSLPPLPPQSGSQDILIEKRRYFWRMR